MVKIGDRNFSVDQAINIVVGSATAISGTACFLAPKKTAEVIVGDVLTPSKSITRLAGPAMIGLGAHSVITGLDKGGSRNKDSLKVSAVELGLISAQCFYEWKKGGDIKEKSVKVAAIGTGLMAAGLVYRATQNKSSGTV